MGKKRFRKKWAWLTDIPVGVCIYFIIIGMIIGYVMVVVTWRDGKLIDRAEAIPAVATYESFKTYYSSKSMSVSEIEIRFSDYETCYIAGACVHADEENALETLQKGEKVELLLHPVSGNIWEMKTDDGTVLSFEDAKSRMRSDNIGFTVIGSFGYLCVAMGAASLLIRWVERRKMKK